MAIKVPRSERKQLQESGSQSLKVDETRNLVVVAQRFFKLFVIFKFFPAPRPVNWQCVFFALASNAWKNHHDSLMSIHGEKAPT